MVLLHMSCMCVGVGGDGRSQHFEGYIHEVQIVYVLSIC